MMRAMRVLGWLFGLLMLVFAGAAMPQDSNLSTMSGAEIRALQQRLTDGGCYHGATDGLASPALQAAVSACPPQDPMLRIETGMHTATIWSVAADPQCRIVATTSDDKTTRIWSGTDGRLVRTLRIAIDSANGGKGRVVAVSDDGRFIAAAGWDAEQETAHQSLVSVFDAASGNLVARLGGFIDVITGLAFSHDGHWLAATGTGTQGLRVYDVTQWRLVTQDTSYQFHSYGVGFGPDGSLYTVSFDGKLRKYAPGPSFARVHEVAARGGREPISIAIDPRGELLAVGFFDSSSISFFDAGTLKYRFAATRQKAVEQGNFYSVTWSNDGERLIAGGSYTIANLWKFPVLLFDRRGRQVGGPIGVADNSIYTIRPCGSRFVFAANNDFGFVDQNGTVQLRRSSAVDMRGRLGDTFTIAPNAKQVRFGLGYDGRTPTNVVDPEVFDVTQGTVSPSPQPQPSFLAPIAQELTSRVSRRIALRPGETPRSMAVLPDRSGFVLGTSYRLRAYEQSGTERWDEPSPDNVWGLNVSADGRIIVAALGDGTVRWYRWSDGKELLALFVNRDSKAWVAWTPSGYYMASPGGEDLIGWHVNRGWNETADFFPASRFRDRFNRPDIVRLMLDTLDEDTAVKQANALAKRREDTQPLIGHLPPIIRITGPADGASVSSNTVTLSYAFRSPSGLPVNRLDLIINGRPVRSIGLPIKSPAADAESTGSVQVTLTQHISKVGLIAWSEGLASQAAQVQVIWNGAPEITRKLYALVVGVSDYADPAMALKFAAKDAGDFAKVLQDQKERYYADVQTRLLTDRQVTRASIIEGLEWLEKSATNPNDVSVLFLAGHGVTDEKQTYWFYTSDSNDANVRINGVSQDELRKSLQGLQGKVLWFLDTCHAGTAAKRPPVDMNVLVNTVSASENGGIVVFASSTGRQVSIEAGDLGNGAFTKAVVEGIDLGKAALGDGFITTSTLDSYVVRRVEEFTGNQQTPVMERPPEEPDFAIAQARK